MKKLKSFPLPELDRLKHLALVVSDCPDIRFDMTRWHCTVLDTRCAGGLAMIVPWFNDLGLKRNGIFPVPKYQGFNSKLLDRKGRGRSDVITDHLAQFFGLNYRQAENLFIMDNCSLSQTKQKKKFLKKLNKIIAKYTVD
jgi:hypothetical protein